MCPRTRPLPPSPSWACATPARASTDGHHDRRRSQQPSTGEHLASLGHSLCRLSPSVAAVIGRPAIASTRSMMVSMRFATVSRTASWRVDHVASNAAAPLSRKAALGLLLRRELLVAPVEVDRRSGPQAADDHPQARRIRRSAPAAPRAPGSLRFRAVEGRSLRSSTSSRRSASSDPASAASSAAGPVRARAPVPETGMGPPDRATGRRPRP